ncbi:MAG: GTPase, partial [Acidobacteriota bacterium]
MGRLVKVVIIGYPNVGKSTLFNRLLEEKRSLVHRLPGMTRDQISSFCTINDRSFILVDTGGFFDSAKDPFSLKVREKAREASQDADVLIFLCDAKQGLSSGEDELFRSLRKLNKSLLVVVNKVDSPKQEENLAEFYKLGEIIPLSAEYK